MPHLTEDQHPATRPGSPAQPARQERDHFRAGDTVASSTTGPVADQEVPRPRRTGADGSMHVRAADLEPYIGLRYLSRLFKLMAVVLILLLVSEVVTGLVTDGLDALPRLLAEVSRLVVFAGLLWGSGDLAILLIDVGHDVRATRILVGRQLAHHTDAQHAHVDPVMAGSGTTTAGEPAPPV